MQSGKTANYTSLICKATDAGFGLIIVLAGIHNNIRSKTQSGPTFCSYLFSSQRSQIKKRIPATERS